MKVGILCSKDNSKMYNPTTGFSPLEALKYFKNKQVNCMKLCFLIYQSIYILANYSIH